MGKQKKRKEESLWARGEKGEKERKRSGKALEQKRELWGEGKKKN